MRADLRVSVSESAMQLCERENSSSATVLSTAAVVAIVCNILVALLILVLIVVLCKACKVPSSQESVPVLTQVDPGAQEGLFKEKETLHALFRIIQECLMSSVKAM
ncbi:hypothetical protein DNTS_028895 [Danionella cerebrum]|uniref:Uncharacterized protein n=1 Tax=Danionella cerebrum TaxID=2873325 RepID=A0A553N4T3_9TELE|nr:hypothetical protein DNTS_028895 [Danionella translucida]